MRIALAQFTAGTYPAANLELVLEQIGRAATAGARLVVFPEAMSCSFARPRIEAAEPLDGPWANAVRQAAVDAGVTVIVGLFTPGRNGKVRNTLLVAGPDLDAHYDKLHLFDAYGYLESEQIEPGNAVVTVAVDGVVCGLSTCYDVRFPELYKQLAAAGAQLIVVPASWAPGERKVEQWRSLAVARALDATCFIVAVDQAEPPSDPDPLPGARRPTGVGHSLVVDPLGEILLELDAEPRLAVIDLDLDAVRTARAALPVLANSRFPTALGRPDRV